jgi:hypothetical protein
LIEIFLLTSLSLSLSLKLYAYLEGGGGVVFVDKGQTWKNREKKKRVVLLGNGNWDIVCWFFKTISSSKRKNSVFVTCEWWVLFYFILC